MFESAVFLFDITWLKTYFLRAILCLQLVQTHEITQLEAPYADTTRTSARSVRRDKRQGRYLCVVRADVSGKTPLRTRPPTCRWLLNTDTQVMRAASAR